MFGFLRDGPRPASVKALPVPANGTLHTLQRGDLGTNRTTLRKRYSQELAINCSSEAASLRAMSYIPMA
jgi:hypothetical protein